MCRYTCAYEDEFVISDDGISRKMNELSSKSSSPNDTCDRELGLPRWSSVRRLQETKGQRAAQKRFVRLFLQRNRYTLACNALKIEHDGDGVFFAKSPTKSEEHDFWGYRDSRWYQLIREYSFLRAWAARPEESFTRMDTVCEIIDEPQQSLVKRIYYSARDGMAIALYTLLSDKSDADVNYLINQVNFD